MLASHLGYLLERPERLPQAWRDLADFLEAHRIRPVVGAEFEFERMPEAHTLMESRKSHGKIVTTARTGASPPGHRRPSSRPGYPRSGRVGTRRADRGGRL